MARERIEEDKKYKRPEEQTFLTLPEWYIVFSPEEYARALKDHPPSDFPYFKSIAQFWSVYHHVIQATWGRYPANWGYHAMIGVIGTSYTLEMAVKGVYENTIGRLTEWVADRRELRKGMGVEAFQQKVAQDYVNFIRLKPWYEYPFYQRFKEYWSQEDAPGQSVIRRVERRVFFSAELLFKSAYAWVISQGTHAAYEPEDLVIGAEVAEHGREKYVHLPRYEAFTQKIPAMIANGTRFIEIAGNKTILMTLIAPRDWNYKAAGEKIYEWPILTDPYAKRIAVAVPVEKLHLILPALNKQGVLLDHVFDY